MDYVFGLSVHLSVRPKSHNMIYSRMHEGHSFKLGGSINFDMTMN